MDGDNIRFRNLYIVITPGRVNVHLEDPRPISDAMIPYVLITVSPTQGGDVIKNITATYFYGYDDGQFTQNQINDIDLFSLTEGQGNTVLERLQHYWLTLNATQQENIINAIEPELNGVFDTNGGTVTGLDIPGGTNFERFITIFLVGLAAHLTIFGILKLKQGRICKPFYPIAIRPPPEDDEMLTVNWGEYLGYYCRIMQGISRGSKTVSGVGPSWLTLIDHHWCSFAPLFIQGTVTNCEMAIHDCIVGYSTHQEKQVRILQEKTEDMNNDVNSTMEVVENNLREATQAMQRLRNDASQQFNNMINKATQTVQDAVDEFTIRVEQDCTTSTSQIEDLRTETESAMTQLRNNMIDSFEQRIKSGESQLQATFARANEQIRSVSNNVSQQMAGIVEEGQNLMGMRGDEIVADLEDKTQKMADRIMKISEQQQDSLAATEAESNEKILASLDESIQRISDEARTHTQVLEARLEETEQRIEEMRKISKDGSKILDGMVKSSMNRITDLHQCLKDELKEEIMRECRDQISAEVEEELIRAKKIIYNESSEYIYKSIDDRVAIHTQDQSRKLTEAKQAANDSQLQALQLTNTLHRYQDALDNIERLQRDHSLQNGNESDYQSRYSDLETMYRELLDRYEHLERSVKSLSERGSKYRYHESGNTSVPNSFSYSELDAIHSNDHILPHPNGVHYYHNNTSDSSSDRHSTDHNYDHSENRHYLSQNGQIVDHHQPHSERSMDSWSSFISHGQLVAADHVHHSMRDIINQKDQQESRIMELNQRVNVIDEQLSEATELMAHVVSTFGNQNSSSRSMYKQADFSDGVISVSSRNHNDNQQNFITTRNTTFRQPMLVPSSNQGTNRSEFSDGVNDFNLNLSEVVSHVRSEFSDGVNDNSIVANEADFSDGIVSNGSDVFSIGGKFLV